MTTEIKIKVSLNDHRVPKKIFWSAPDGNVQNQETEALLLSVWDSKNQEALRIDLWTKKMKMDEMKEFVKQIFFGLSDTYLRSTSDEEGTKKIRHFAKSFTGHL